MSQICPTTLYLFTNGTRIYQYTQPTPSVLLLGHSNSTAQIVTKTTTGDSRLLSITVKQVQTANTTQTIFMLTTGVTSPVANR